MYKLQILEHKTFCINFLNFFVVFNSDNFNLLNSILVTVKCSSAKYVSAEKTCFECKDISYNQLTCSSILVDCRFSYSYIPQLLNDCKLN